MTRPPRSWLPLRLAALCHLTVLLAGQHHGVNKCKSSCDKMTSQIHLKLLSHYENISPSCGKSAIILVTKKNRSFCADPAEAWVREAIINLDHQTAATTKNAGTPEKRISEPRTTPAARTMYQLPMSEPEATVENSSLELTPLSPEAQRSLGASPELPAVVTGSSGTKSPSVSKVEDESPSPGPKEMELFTVTPLSTRIAWQSSAAYQTKSSLWVESKASETPSTETPSTEAPSTETPSTEALSTEATSTETPSAEAPSTEAPSAEVPSTEAPQAEVPSTQVPSTEALSVSYPAPKDSTGTEGQPIQVTEPMPENSSESKETGAVTAHTDAFLDWGPSSMAHASVVPISSVGTEGRRAPKAEESNHTTAGHQSLSVLTTPVPDAQAATRRQAVGLLAFLGLLFSLGVAMFAYQSLQGCSRRMAGEVVEGLRYVPRSCGSNSYVLVPV